MAFSSMVWAVRQRDLSASAFRILMALADAENAETGQCNPSQDFLANLCEMSKRSVRTHLAALEVKGLIKRKINRGVIGEVIGTSYQLHTLLEAKFSSRGGSGDIMPPLGESDGRPKRQLISANHEPVIEPIPPLFPQIDAIGTSAFEGGGCNRNHALAPRLSAETDVKELWPGFVELRDSLKADPRFGEGWCKSYLDHCRVGPSGEVIPFTGIAFDQLKRSGALNSVRLVHPSRVSSVFAISPAEDAVRRR